MNEYDDLANEYQSALRRFVDGGGEMALAQAYELGRDAVGTGIGVVEIALIYDRAVQKLPNHDATLDAAQFLIESLSPFEMTHRGFREANERLEHANRQLQASNRELEAFAYSVSHDLRAPLRSIGGFIEILVDELGPKLEQTSRSHFDRVRRAVGRMSELIDGLFELSRASQGSIARERVDVSAVATAVVDELRGRDAAREVEVDIEPGLAMRGDPRLMRVVLDNLLGNAWKFTSKRAEPLIRVGAEEDVFFVRDNGVGFDVANAERLFSPFQRFHDSTEFPGTGIGLATVRRIVERHGGRIWADAMPGRGATFFFTCG